MIRTRRSIRQFSTKKIPDSVIESAILAAGTAPSGAHKQPWLFAVIENPEVKKQIRAAAEEEERAFYERRASEQWLNDLKPLGTDSDKPYLERASHLIAIFAKLKDEGDGDSFGRTYYPIESTCIATGILITALHNAGVGTLTHTPKPLKFLNRSLGLASHYRPLILLVAGYPEQPVSVPRLERKSLGEITKFY